MSDIQPETDLIDQAVSMSLTVLDRNERPSKLLSVLLCQRAAAVPLCDLGASAATGQVRTLVWTFGFQRILKDEGKSEGEDNKNINIYI